MESKIDRQAERSQIRNDAGYPRIQVARKAHERAFPAPGSSRFDIVRHRAFGLFEAEMLGLPVPMLDTGKQSIGASYPLPGLLA